MFCNLLPPFVYIGYLGRYHISLTSLCVNPLESRINFKLTECDLYKTMQLQNDDRQDKEIPNNEDDLSINAKTVPLPNIIQPPRRILGKKI